MTDKLVMLAVLAAGLIGDCDCDRGERGAPQSSPAPTAEAQERMAVLAERIAQVASSDRGDCQKLAGDLGKLADEQKPQLLETSPRAMPSDDKDDESLPSV